MDKEKIIFSIIAVLAVLEMGIIGSSDFLKSYNGAAPRMKGTIVVSQIAPAALSGKWSLLTNLFTKNGKQ